MEASARLDLLDLDLSAEQEQIESTDDWQQGFAQHTITSGYHGLKVSPKPIRRPDSRRLPYTNKIKHLPGVNLTTHTVQESLTTAQMKRVSVSTVKTGQSKTRDNSMNAAKRKCFFSRSHDRFHNEPLKYPIFIPVEKQPVSKGKAQLKNLIMSFNSDEPNPIKIPKLSKLFSFYQRSKSDVNFTKKQEETKISEVKASEENPKKLEGQPEQNKSKKPEMTVSVKSTTKPNNEEAKRENLSFTSGAQRNSRSSNDFNYFSNVLGRRAKKIPGIVIRSKDTNFVPKTRDVADRDPIRSPRKPKKAFLMGKERTDTAHQVTFTANNLKASYKRRDFFKPIAVASTTPSQVELSTKIFAFNPIIPVCVV